MSVHPSVRTSIRPQKVFPIPMVKVKVTRTLKLEILRFSKCISSAIFNVSWQVTTDSETTEQYLTFVRNRFLIYVLVFVSRDFELGTAWHWQSFTYWERFPILATFRQIQEVHWRRLRTDVTTNLEESQISEAAVPYGANFITFAFLLSLYAQCSCCYAHPVAVVVYIL